MISTKALAFLLLAGLAWPAFATPLPYAFTLEAPSGIIATQVSLTAETAGTLTGNFDEVSNPTGTRTKPGLFGTFGPTENVPVPTQLDLGLTGMPSIASVGGFQAEVDSTAGTIAVANYATTMDGASMPGVTLTLGIDTAGFRTRSPNSLFPGGDFTIPVGNAALTGFTITQVGPSLPVTLTPVGTDRYEFTAPIAATLDLSFEFLGNPTTLPPIPIVLPLSGTLELAGPQATIAGFSNLDIEQLLTPQLALPSFPLALPTLLPPGDTANVVLSLTLARLEAAFDARVTTQARGVLIPEPSCGALLLVMLACQAIGRRRRAAIIAAACTSCTPSLAGQRGVRVRAPAAGR